jgi:hypothetical protein
VRPPQVVAERLGAQVGALVAGSGEQVVDQLAADPQLSIGQPAQPGQLDGEHGGAVLQGHHVRGARAAARVDQGDQPEHAGARRGQRDHPAVLPHRPARGHQPAQQLFPLVGRRLRVPGRLARAGPCGQVAVAVLYRHREPGQVVQCLGDAGRALAGRRDPGEPLVDGHPVAQRGHRLLERPVGGGQLLRGVPFPAVQLGVGHRDPGLLGQHLGQELFFHRGLLGGLHDQVPQPPAEAAQRIGPGPRGLPAGPRAARLGQRAQLAGQLRVRGAAGLAAGPPVVANLEAGDLPAAQRGGRRGGQPQDLLAVGALRHQDGQHQEGAQVGQLTAEQTQLVAVQARGWRARWGLNRARG